MSKNQKRLLMSLVLSVMCACGIHFWYKSKKLAANDYGNRSPIARLSGSTNDVQRKPLKRLIWQSLVNNDSLFAGEQIRTANDAAATIELTKSGTTIELEPDSLITLEESDGKISLDFVQGNLFVKGGTADDSLSLKSGDQEIALGGSELSLGKKADGKVDLQVFKGDVDGKKAPADPFEVISPKPQAEVQVAVDGSEKILWEWKKDLEPNFVVSLEMGKSRSQLKPFTDFSRDGKKLLASLKPGDHYWRLSATDAANPVANLASQIYKIKVLPKRPPLAVAPGRDQEVPFTESPQKVVFKWVNPGKLHHIAIELAESEDFTKGKISYLVNEKEFFEGKLQKAGVYYWRLSGQTGKEGTVLTSPIMKFIAQDGKTARAPTAVEEKPVVTKLPTINMKSLDPILKHQYFTPKPEMFVEWQPGPANAKTYTVSFRQDKEKFGEPLKVTTTSARTPVPKDGRWIVKIDALDANGKLVAEGAEKPIDIEAAPLLPAPRYDQALANPITSSKRGEMNISWTPVTGAKQYQISLKDDEGKVIQEQTLTENQFAFKKLKPGEFNVTVWAIDQQARRGIASERRRAVVPKTSDVGAPKVKIKVQ